MSEGDMPPVVKSLRVALPPSAAFELFTRELARWWPLATHSCAGADAVDVVIEPHAGGRVTEHARDGRQAPWGTVLAWDPPRHFAMSWHPASDPAMATRVDVRFAAADGGGCRLELIHSGWEVRGGEGAAVRERYDDGWVKVLERYAQATRQRMVTEAR